MLLSAGGGGCFGISVADTAGANVLQSHSPHLYIPTQFMEDQLGRVQNNNVNNNDNKNNNYNHVSWSRFDAVNTTWATVRSDPTLSSYATSGLNDYLVQEVTNHCAPYLL